MPFQKQTPEVQALLDDPFTHFVLSYYSDIVKRHHPDIYDGILELIGDCWLLQTIDPESTCIIVGGGGGCTVVGWWWWWLLVGGGEGCRSYYCTH